MNVTKKWRLNRAVSGLVVLTTIVALLQTREAVAAWWDGPCVANSECDDGDPCTLDECQPSGSCLSHRTPGACCEVDSDCFDGNPCTTEWCSTQGSSAHCEYKPLYVGCCTQWFTDDCSDENDSCYSGGCDLHAYTASLYAWSTNGHGASPQEVTFGSCARTPGCCFADVQCNDSDEATLDWCNEGTMSCSFPGPGGWCDVGQGYCDGLGGMQMGTPGGLGLLHVFDCDLCLNWTIRDYCALGGTCSGTSCCETDADCEDQDPLTVDSCDTNVSCSVLSGGIAFGSASGTCSSVAIPGGCRTPIDCIPGTSGNSVLQRCELFDGTPLCHTDGC